jgi:secondary thiamine-phosphate synthase enzyme
MALGSSLGHNQTGSHMTQFTTLLRVRTRGKGLYEITREIEDWVSRQGVETGLLTVFVQHTSASLVIQENADPDVIRDLNDFFSRLAPENDRLYRHMTEGADDMPAHIRAALTQSHLSIPVIGASLALGTWQGVYVFEHRAAVHTRTVVLHFIGE